MRADELEFEVPPELIAQAPLQERDGARLLCMRRDELQVQHRQVRELPELLEPSLIVLNDTRVIPARLHVHKPSGGKVEFLLIERLPAPGVSERWSALGKPAKGLQTGMQLSAAAPGAQQAGSLSVRIDACLGAGEFELSLHAAEGVERALAQHGRLPLPPYIRRTPDSDDSTR